MLWCRVPLHILMLLPAHVPVRVQQCVQAPLQLLHRAVPMKLLQ